jgi:transposase
MVEKSKCPRCQHPKNWRVRRGKLRCAACHYEWVPRALPLRLTRAQWRRLLRWFMLGQSSASIAREARLERRRVLRALRVVRQAMAKDISPVFFGAGKSTHPAFRVQEGKRGRGTTKQAVFRIMWQGGQVFAEVVPRLDAKTLLPLLRKQIVPRSLVNFRVPSAGIAIAAGGQFTRLVDPGRTLSSGPSGQINAPEGFWGYLKVRLAAKGGIRRGRLPLYLAEYVWRYNHRRLSVEDQVKRLFRLLQR